MIRFLHTTATSKTLALCLLWPLLTSCSSNETQVEAVSLKRLLSEDRRVEFSTYRFEGIATFFNDGSAKISIPALGDDDGVWLLDHDKICIKWQKALGGKQRCSHLYTEDDKSFSVREINTGVKLGTITLL